MRSNSTAFVYWCDHAGEEMRKDGALVCGSYVRLTVHTARHFGMDTHKTVRVSAIRTPYEVELETLDGQPVGAECETPDRQLVRGYGWNTERLVLVE